MKLVEAGRLWALILAAAAVVPAACGIWLELPEKGTKCISEELYSNVVVMGDYYVFYGERDDVNSTDVPSISVKVTSPIGNSLYHQEKTTQGHFAFTTTDTGTYLACFSVNEDNPRGRKPTVGLEWKTGIAAKDWDSVAKKEKIEGLELELRKLEGAAKQIQENFYRVMSREMEMKRVNDKTNERVAWYSISSIGVCIVVSVFQLWYLRRYFHRKKLI